MKNMKKAIFWITVLIPVMSIVAQTGINIKNPKAVLHVDGSKDNNAEGNPTAAQQGNDVVIDALGNVGIGTITPTTKLDINSSSVGQAIKIVDGTQGDGKVVTSNSSGVGSWTTPASIKPTVLGTFPTPASTVSSSGGTGLRDSGIYIDLSRGRWVVSVGLTFGSIGADVWQHVLLSSRNNSSNTTGFIFLGPAGANTAYAGNLVRSTESLGFISGSSVIDVTVDTIRIYILIRDKPVGTYTFRSSNWENFVYAIPIN